MMGNNRRTTKTAADAITAAEGPWLVITAGVPFGTPGNTNILRIAWVGAE